MQAERRNASRQDCFKIGDLLFPDFGRSEDCLVWNLSSGGAMVELPPSVDLPERCRLSLWQFNLDRHCRRVWQAGRKAGLAFLD